MKRLQSLESFRTDKLDEVQLTSVMGGAAGPTKGGERCTAASNTGCMGYTSDTDHGGSKGVTYHGKFEVDKSCEEPE